MRANPYDVFRPKLLIFQIFWAGATPASGGAGIDAEGLPKKDGTAATLAGQHCTDAGPRDPYQRSISTCGKFDHRLYFGQFETVSRSISLTNDDSLWLAYTKRIAGPSNTSGRDETKKEEFHVSRCVTSNDNFIPSGKIA